jgi:uncharacterized protein (DUF427 family)
MRPTPITPQSGQESVWDYPRPARLEDTAKHLRIVFNGVTIASTDRAKRVLETSHPPVYYIPAEDIKLEYLIETAQRTWCEWKGWSTYYNLSVGDRQVTNAAWRYIDPTPNFSGIHNSYSFYGSLMDACYVNDELITPQAGDYYGGWITADIVGPFKGDVGTRGW